MLFELGLSSKVDEYATAYWLLFKGNRILILKDKVEFTRQEIDLYKLSNNLVRGRYLDRVEVCGMLLNLPRIRLHQKVCHLMT